MTVRFASKEDTELLTKVRFDFFAEENWDISNDLRQTIKDQLDSYYNEHLNKDFFAVFAEHEGNIASVAFLVIIEKPANIFFPTGKVGLILNVLTYSRYRQKGYATMVLNALIEKAKEQNASFIELSASPMGKKLYEKLGFAYSERPNMTPMKLNL